MSDQVSSISVCQAGFGTAVIYRSAVPFQFPFFFGDVVAVRGGMGG